MTDYHASYDILDGSQPSTVSLTFTNGDNSGPIAPSSTQTMGVAPSSDYDSAFVGFNNSSTNIYGVKLDWSKISVPINAGLDSKTHGFWCGDPMHFEIIQSAGRQIELTATPNAFVVNSFANCTVTVDGREITTGPLTVSQGSKLVCRTTKSATGENLRLELDAMPKGHYITLSPNCDIEVKSTGSTIFFIGSAYDAGLLWWLQISGDVSEQDVHFDIVDTAGNILFDPTFKVLRNKTSG